MAQKEELFLVGIVEQQFLSTILGQPLSFSSYLKRWKCETAKMEKMICARKLLFCSVNDWKTEEEKRKVQKAKGGERATKKGGMRSHNKPVLLLEWDGIGHRYARSKTPPSLSLSLSYFIWDEEARILHPPTADGMQKVKRSCLEDGEWRIKWIN